MSQERPSRTRTRGGRGGRGGSRSVNARGGVPVPASFHISPPRPGGAALAPADSDDEVAFTVPTRTARRSVLSAVPRPIGSPSAFAALSDARENSPSPSPSPRRSSRDRRPTTAVQAALESFDKTYYCPIPGCGCTHGLGHGFPMANSQNRSTAFAEHVNSRVDEMEIDEEQLGQYMRVGSGNRARQCGCCKKWFGSHGLHQKHAGPCYKAAALALAEQADDEEEVPAVGQAQPPTPPRATAPEEAAEEETDELPPMNLPAATVADEDDLTQEVYDLQQHLAAGKRMLKYVPADAHTRLAVQKVYKACLEEILAAVDAGAVDFLSAWNEFLSLPRHLFQNERGGKAHRNQVGKRVDDATRRYWQGREGGTDHLGAAAEMHVEQVSDGGKDPVRNRVLQAQTELEHGNVSKAMSILATKPIGRISVATLDECLQQFPQGQVGDMIPLPDNATPLIVDPCELAKVIKKLSGKAAGPSSFAPDLFMPIREDPALLELYAQVLSVTFSNEEIMSPALAALLLGARLVAPEKPKKKPDGTPTHRALTVSEAALQHAQLSGLRQIDKMWLRRMLAINQLLAQFGIAVPAGMEKGLANLETAVLLAADGNYAMAAGLFDCVDAFQTVDRMEMLKVVFRFEEAKPIWRISHFLFSNPAPRYAQMEDGSVKVFYQEQGGAQGWVLMALCFCLAVHEALRKMLMEPNDPLASAGAFIDDLNVVGQFSNMLQVFFIAKRELRKKGLEVSLSKTVVVVNDKESYDEEVCGKLEEEGIKVVEGHKVLGAFLSSNEDLIRSELEKKYGPDTPDMQRLWQAIAHPAMNPRDALVYLTDAIQHHLDYLCRVSSPRLTESLFEEFDKKIIDSVLRKFNLLEHFDALPEHKTKLELQVRQLQLPRTNFAGMGIRPTVVLSKIAWLASKAACATEILLTMEQVAKAYGADTRAPCRYELDYKYCRDFLFARASALEALKFSDKVTDGIDVSDLPDIECLPATLIEFLRTFQQYPHLAIKFQKRLSTLVWKADYARLHTDSSPEDRVRLDAYCVEDAGRIWSMKPTARCLYMAPTHCEQALRLQLGKMPSAAFYLRAGQIMCPCCRKVDLKKVPAHFQHCAKLRRGPVLRRHDGTCTLLYKVGYHNGVPVMWTPYMEAGGAPDLGFTFDGQFVVVEVTITSSDAPSNVKKALAEAAKSAERAAGRKIGKYAKKGLQDWSGSALVPFALTSAGGIPKAAGIFIKRLAQAGTDNMIPGALTRTEIRDRLAVTVQIGNALTNLDGLNRSRTLTTKWADAKQRRRSRLLLRGNSVGR